MVCGRGWLNRPQRFAVGLFRQINGKPKKIPDAHLSWFVLYLIQIADRPP
jgi:hypothetical protein